jgi:hypothetical protein
MALPTCHEKLDEADPCDYWQNFFSGTFRFRCSVTCGPLHPLMIGKIQVGDNALLWRAGGLAVLAVAAILWRRLS